MDWSLGQPRQKKRIPLRQAEKIARRYFKRLEPYCEFIMVAGSIRRRRPQIGDVEFVVLPFDVDEFLDALEPMGFSGGRRKQVFVGEGPKIEIYIAHEPDELGAMVLTYTGDYQFNIAMRFIAKRRGWKLDQYGLRDAKSDEWILKSPYEEDFFGALGVDYHTPEERSFSERKKGRASMGDITPRDWSPRGEIPGHVIFHRDWLARVGWDGKEWREADRRLDDHRVVWYGPGGEKGDYATELESYQDHWIVREYSAQEKEGPDHILMITAYFEHKLVVDALFLANMMKTPLEVLRDEDPWSMYRYAVSLGVAQIAYNGGDESWVDALP
jgi:hypothetical protein